LFCWEKKNESAGFSKKDLQELQNRETQRRFIRYLQREKAQAETGLTK
jgi:hypothetical protein